MKKLVNVTFFYKDNNGDDITMNEAIEANTSVEAMVNDYIGKELDFGYDDTELIVRCIKIEITSPVFEAEENPYPIPWEIK